MLELAARHRWPVVCWSEGGGARATELNYQGGMVTTFVQFPRLSGLVPIVTVLSGPSFAGQANIAGCSDVVIATRSSTMGLSGPPLVQSATGERLTPRGHRADGPPRPHRHRRRAGRGRGRGRSTPPAATSLLPAADPTPPGEAPRAAQRSCARWCPRTRAGPTTCARVVAGIADVGSRARAAAPLGPLHRRPASSASAVGRRRDRQQPDVRRRRHRP